MNTKKRVICEDLPKDLIKEEYKDEAYAYIDQEFHLLRHHNADVVDGMECESIDETLLDLSISMVTDVLMFDVDTKENILEHLNMHREQLAARKKCKQSKKTKITNAALLNVVKEKYPDIKNACAAISKVETGNTTIAYYIHIEDDGIEDSNKPYPAPYIVRIDVLYDQDGNVVDVRIFDTIVPVEFAEDLLKFIANLPKLS